MVYLHLLWLGNVSTKFEKQITTAIQCYYFVVETQVVFTTRPLHPTTKKDILPAHYYNNVIYQFMCYCDSWYVGCTFQRLQERIKHLQKPSFFPRLLQSFPCLQETAHLKSSLMILLLDSIFWKTLPVPTNTVTPNSLPLPKDVLLSTAVLKLHLSNLLNLIYVDTRNFFQQGKLIH